MTLFDNAIVGNLSLKLSTAGSPLGACDYRTTPVFNGICHLTENLTAVIVYVCIDFCSAAYGKYSRCVSSVVHMTFVILILALFTNRAASHGELLKVIHPTGRSLLHLYGSAAFDCTVFHDKAAFVVNATTPRGQMS